MTWQRISATEYRLDDVWTVKYAPGTHWRVYRDGEPCPGVFMGVWPAMQEAERLRKEDEERG